MSRFRSAPVSASRSTSAGCGAARRISNAWRESWLFHWSMIFSDLPSPAEAGFAKAGNRLPPGSSPGQAFSGSCSGGETGMQAKELGIAVVGSGRIGTLRARLAAKHPAVRFVAVSDKDPANAKTLAELAGADFHSGDNDEAISRPEVNAVFV